MEETKPKKLTGKQKEFCRLYVDTFHITNSAIGAGYSKKTAYQIGSENLNKVEIKLEVKRLLDEKQMGEEEIKIRLADIARGDIGRLMDIESMSFDISMKKAKEQGLTKLIRKVKQITKTTTNKDGTEEETNIQELELYSAADALEFLAKMHGMVTDKVDMTSKGESINIDDEKSNRTLMALSDALGKIVHAESAEQNSSMGSSE